MCVGRYVESEFAIFRTVVKSENSDRYTVRIAVQILDISLE